MFDLSNIYDVVDTMPELHIIATMVSLLLSTAASFYASLMKRKKKGRFSLIARSRRSMRYFIQQLGPRNFRRAYRMTPRQYWKLCGLLKPYLAPKKGVGPNGHIYPEIEISATLRYLAGGDPYDIHLTHGIGYTTFFSCVWRVINAINSCPALKIRFPTDHKLQKKIAHQFKAKSRAGFSNVVGCIDGMLVWTEKPSEKEARQMKCGSGRFYCSRKGKYGFNMQGVCDARGRFLQLWIKHPAAASDFLAFIRSNFYQRLQEDGYLAAGLVILGDCAYVSTSYMVTPYKNVRAGPKDNFNFYHSQLRITIECAFGMLVHRWAILRRPLASRMGVKEQIALTVAACRLHNFCIDTSENATSNISEVEDVDELTTVRTTNAGGVELTDDGRPNQLLDGGEHFEDVTDKDIRDQEKSKVRFEMRKIVEEKGLRRVIRRSNETT